MNHLGMARTVPGGRAYSALLDNSPLELDRKGRFRTAPNLPPRQREFLFVSGALVPLAAGPPAACELELLRAEPVGGSFWFHRAEPGLLQGRPVEWFFLEVRSEDGNYRGIRLPSPLGPRFGVAPREFFSGETVYVVLHVVAGGASAAQSQPVRFHCPEGPPQTAASFEVARSLGSALWWLLRLGRRWVAGHWDPLLRGSWAR